ncbi:hypothetical protein ACTG0T_10300 [Halococcus morrhuae DSM 1307]|uniref:hypothetical protein n=1 Tax=Halococcus morrhuae TaxID=2250 RepID=UPI000677D306
METPPLRWLRESVQETWKEYRKNGLDGAQHGVTNAWQDFFVQLNRQYVQHRGNPGESIYSRDWDVMLILDDMRVDIMHEVANEYDFVTGIDTFRSLGSKSPDWMERNFDNDHPKETARTAYVTGNPFSRMFDGSEFRVFDEVWRYAWDEDRNTIPARALTDRAVRTWRQRGKGMDRMVVHYMQPHDPFVPDPELGTYGSVDSFGREGFGNLWSLTGYTVPRERVWQAYRDNLRYVLDDVTLLLENIDAERVVITADHGHAAGELGLWGHPSDLLLPCVREVPWVETDAVDTETHEPSLEQPDDIAATDADEAVVRERLRDLGYAE